MNAAIAGLGWVTPLGGNIDKVWQRLLAGDEAVPEKISAPVSSKAYPAYRVPPDGLPNLPAHPRLRRASAISRFAASAGLAALQSARSRENKIEMSRTALIFATSNGGVIYTKRFYHDIVEAGAQKASPLLFPETVFNAPASHLAAILGITGASYTLVGDAAVGILALKMADDLLQSGNVDLCLVVAAEEADWLLCDAYRKWRLLRSAPPVELFEKFPRGMILSEGAGAVAMAREGEIKIEKIHAGGNFRGQREAAAELEKIYLDLGADKIEMAILSANGTFIDRAELAALDRHGGRAIFYSPKPSLGEGVAAATLWQIICAAQALKTGELPPLLHAGARPGAGGSGKAKSGRRERVLISACGLNQQAAGAVLRHG